MRRLLPDSILARTALVLVAAVVVALAVAITVFSGSRHEALQSLGGRNAAERVAAMVTLLEDTPAHSRSHTLRAMDTPGFRAGWGSMPVVEADDDSPLARRVARHLRNALDGRMVLVDSSGRFRPPIPETGLGSRRHFHHGEPRPGSFIHISVQLTDGSWLNVAAPMERGESLWQGKVLLPLAAALLAVILAALWAVRRAARPFATFATAAERLGMDVAAPPLPEHGPKEVRRAAQAFNLMQHRIRRFVDDRTHMLAAISHDLRTPITRLKLRAEFVEDEEERTRMLADLDEMEHMITATLAFARDDAAHEEHRPVDIAALVQGVAEDMGADYHGPDSLISRARPMALKRALTNLLDNARKYGGAAQATVENTPQEIAVIIEDEGPGIPEAEFERVFAPFFRLEASRNRDTGGSGLGLAIARAAIRAHGGDILLGNRPQGGLRVCVTLPKG